MIEVNSISKKFKLSKKQRRESGKKQKFIQSVKDVSFKCRQGRVFTLLGPNGAGKTTILRMIATMLKPDSGTIKVEGFDTVKQAGKVRENIGFLTGSTGLYARLTPDEIIKYYADLYDLENKYFKERKDSIFKSLGINEFSKRRIGKLSSGMKQKVSIARTLIHNPNVVIFDEPTVGLDVITSRNIIKLIRDCKEEGKTVIFSTHIMGEVNMLSDDLAIIHEGEMVYLGTFSKFKSEMKEKTLEDEFVRIIGGNL